MTLYLPFIVDETRIDSILCVRAGLIIEEGCTRAIYAPFPVDEDTVRTAENPD